MARNVAVALATTNRTFSDMSDSSSPTPLEISVEEARDLLTTQPEGVFLLDVREPSEYETARIVGSKLIPMKQIGEHLSSLPKDKRLLIHCHHGGRSLRVTQYLRAQGYPHATNIAGGIHAWSQRIDPAVPTY